MERYVLVPDSFKGTLGSGEICAILREEILRAKPDAEVVSIPVADGGEGSVDAFLTAVGGQRVQVPCHGPHMEEMTGFYGLLPDGTAVVEMAAAAGLPLAGNRLEPDTATTYGVGELMADAAARGARCIILGLGGSATNDGGCGAAAALGARFLDGQGKTFLPTGGTWTALPALTSAASGLCRRSRSCATSTIPSAAPRAPARCSDLRKGRTRRWCGGWTGTCAIWRR